MIEFWLAFATNIVGTECVLAWASLLLGTVAIVGHTIASGQMNDEDHSKSYRADWSSWEKVWRMLRNACLKVFIPACLISMVPSPKNIWEMRIALIKFNLASPQNVQMAADKIVEIGHKLECKYIGCEEPKEKK